ncbi:MAG: outer membrane lipoprotein chaperone LolA [Candidatus Nitricoxidivorans perseverans]|uniref:Outer-membrane lipoprotein carrier protein n=1 Tax=Candidatus Nitricoxidivorans perseverans TaxID=2975601 RepID=A0AA49FMA5_9PROT|nr:MAG: outer membrane lipoprotein chaperone LolA [Candidatus Nitricoxidivorans perseverans]
MPKTLIALCGLLLATAAQASGLDQLKDFLDQTRSARGSFVQSVVGKSGRKPQQSAGFFAFARPGKFRWSYEKPYQQLLVSDGEKLWSFDPDLNQVTVRKLGQAFGSSPAALLAGDALENSFVLREGGAAEGFEFVEATPKAQDGTFERVRIGFKDKLPRIMEVRDNFGQTTTLFLNQIESNEPLPAGVFRFAPPKGADVVGE